VPAPRLEAVSEEPEKLEEPRTVIEPETMRSPSIDAVPAIKFGEGRKRLLANDIQQ